MSQCNNFKLDSCLYCSKHSKELLYGNINVNNTEGWKGNYQNHSKSFIQKMNNYFDYINNINIEDNNGCFAL